jgi:rare lipoprotein A
MFYKINIRHPGRVTPLTDRFTFKRFAGLMAFGGMVWLSCSYPAGRPLPVGRVVRVEYGTASYYGTEFEGRHTASGKTFNPLALTAAHRTLPFGTKVRVTSMQTRWSLIVRINDRGPFKPGRIIDLSYEAARRLGVLNEGTFKVKLEILK